jgi:hypothetical protein
VNIDNFFDKEVFSLTFDELLEDIDFMLSENLPEGKEVSDFTGGYVQQLKNSTKFVAYFGTKINSNNKCTVPISIPDEEVDLMYMMLKAKMYSMRNNGSVEKKYSIKSKRSSATKVVKPKKEPEPIILNKNSGTKEQDDEDFEWN